MPSMDRARAKHNELVAQLAKLQARENKYLDRAFKTRTAKDKVVRAIARSSKRLEKLAAAMTHNPATSASVVDPLVEAVDTKPTVAPLHDDVPTFGTKSVSKRPRGHADLNDFANTFGPAVREAAEDAGLTPRKKKRRTPDDLRAELDKRK